MADEPENLTIRLLQEMRVDMLKGFQQTVESFEKVYLRIAELNTKIAAMQKEVAEQNQPTREVVLRLTAHDKRFENHDGCIEALEKAR
jgi:hypothetical protein